MMRIAYLKHSGFAVRTEAHQLLFDYIGDRFEPDPAVPTIALASHVHGDHYAPQITRLADACVLGEGIEPFEGARVMRPGEALELMGVEIRAFGSTDCGVSFLVRADGLSVFHAGDLNLWHWRWESTPEEVRAAVAAFDAVLDELVGLPVDVAFFPVDARMGAGHDEGADIYLRRVRPRVLIPMHWWGRPEVARAYAAKHAGGETRVIAMTEPGGEIELF